MKKITTLLLLFAVSSSFSQIKGKVTDSKNNPLSFVSIYLDGTITGTTSNDEGYYELPIKRSKKYTVVFQFLGFKTLKKDIQVSASSYTLNVKLNEESVALNEVQINSKENPANEIIRNVIANKKKNESKIQPVSYTHLTLPTIYSV